MTKRRSATGGGGDLLLRCALVALVAAAIVYGSLYPFVFRDLGAFSADLLHLAKTWKHPPQSRGDTIANLLLYMPLGFTLVRLVGPHRSLIGALVISVTIGALLSFAIELAQFYDASRVSTLSDVYLNAVGALAGAVIACLTDAGSVRVSWPSGSAPAFARLLLVAWVAWRLYPYVPNIDLHQYWRSIRLLLAGDMAVTNILRYIVLWLSVIFLIRIGLAPKRLMWSALLAASCFFAAKIMVIGQSLSLPEVVGAALAVLLGSLMLQRYARVGVPCLAAFMTLVIIAFRLQPWHVTMTPNAFQWAPFQELLHGSFQFQIVSLAGKLYLYGVMLLLLVAAGMKLRTAVFLEGALLLATSVLRMFLVGRSAEITDPLLVLALGLLFALLRQFSANGGGATARAGRQAA